MNSKIHRGEVTHERLGPERHAFTYPVTFFAFDLDEIDHLPAHSRLFGRNRTTAVLSLRNSDYLKGEDRPIAGQLDNFLPPQEAGERTLLVTSPRYLGYAFNPVNFYLRMQGGTLRAAVAEVNNTFGDRHVYPLTTLAPGPAKNTWTARCPKEFHVSPFNNRVGEYHFTFRVTETELFLGVDLHRDGNCVMKTWIAGRGHTLTNRAILRHAFLHPFDTALNSMPRILWQAAVLHYRKRMKVYRRPRPASSHTLIDRDHPVDSGIVL